VFDPVAGTLEGTLPRDFTGSLTLLVAVRDGQGHVHEVPLQLTAERHAADQRESRPAMAAKPALDAQFGRQRHGGDHAALLRQLAVAQRHATPAPVHP
jgi:hypothetical protein